MLFFYHSVLLFLNFPNFLSHTASASLLSLFYICSLSFSSHSPLLSQSLFLLIVTICLSFSLSSLHSICRPPLFPSLSPLSLSLHLFLALPLSTLFSQTVLINSSSSLFLLPVCSQWAISLLCAGQ